MPPKMKDLTDEDILLSLLEHPSKLDRFQTKVFNEWIGFVQKGGQLSVKQRDFARSKFKALDLIETFNAENLASEMKATGAKTDARTMDALESLMGPKPMSPPPRSNRNY